MTKDNNKSIFLPVCTPHDVSKDEKIGDPEVIHYKKSFVIPSLNSINDSPCGVFDEYGNLLISASNINGKEKKLDHVNPEMFLKTNINFSKTIEKIYWGGCIIGHYGHFIMDVLPRWWAYKNYKYSGYKLGINIKGHTESEILSMNWLREFLIIIGIDREDLYVFKSNTCVESMMIAYPLFMDRNYYHKSISSFFWSIGKNAESFVPKEKFTGEYYLSRKKLKSGTRQIVNENEIEEIMKKNKIEILYPEELSVFEQISIFRRGKVYGFLSSAFHNSAFAKNSNGLCFSLSREINRSYSLFDSSSNSNIIYVNTPNDHTKKDHGFFLSTKVKDLEKIERTIIGYRENKIEKSFSYSKNKNLYCHLENGPFYIENYFGDIAYYSQEGEEINFYNDGEEKAIVYIYGDIAFLCLKTTNNPRVFTTQKDQFENKYSFRDLKTDMYVSMRDNTKGRILSYDRLHRRDWEKFSLKLGGYDKDGFIKILDTLDI